LKNYQKVQAGCSQRLKILSEINVATPEEIKVSQTQKQQIAKLTQFKAEFFKALSNPLRIRILDELRNDELTVSEIRDRLEVELPNVSQQLAVLKAKNLVTARKQGINIYYSCSDPKIFKLLDVAREIFNSQLADIQKTLKKL